MNDEIKKCFETFLKINERAMNRTKDVLSEFEKIFPGDKRFSDMQTRLAVLSSEREKMKEIWENDGTFDIDRLKEVHEEFEKITIPLKFLIRKMKDNKLFHIRNGQLFPISFSSSSSEE